MLLAGMRAATHPVAVERLDQVLRYIRRLQPKVGKIINQQTGVAAALVLAG